MKREKEREREREREGEREREREKETETDTKTKRERERERETHFLVQPKGAYLMSLSCNTACNHDNRKPRTLVRFPTHPSHGYCSEGPDQVTLDTCRRLKREYLWTLSID